MLMTGARAVARCDELAKPPYSDTPDGLYRGYLTPAHRAALDQTTGWMHEAGMTARIDAAVNLIGRYEGTHDAPPLIIASHIDSVRDAGAYDGPLGVMLGIECVAALYRAGRHMPFPIEVIAFGDEEGSRFPAAMLSSKAIAGTLGDLPDMADHEGISLTTALGAFGTSPAAMQAARHPGALAYLEAHIEQGPVLEADGLALGVVTGIAAQLRFAVVVTGQAGHAGTSSMALRRDALTGAAEMVLAIETAANRHGGDLVATVGKLETLPGAANVIPGEVRFTIDVRAGDEARRDAAAQDMRGAIQDIADRRGLECRVTRVHDLPASPCDPRLIKLLDAALTDAGHRPRRLVSGAGHDAMVMAALAPTAMLFIRCRAGISHNPAEHVDPADADAALAVMLGFIEKLESALFNASPPGLVLDPLLFGEIDPPQRLLMGPGPVNAHPRVLRAMSADLLGQFDPEMTAYMNQVMALYRPLFGTQNRWTMLVDGTARAAIEAALVSLVQPGETVLVINFGRFGLLLQEILLRIGARFETVDAPWGEVVPAEAIRAAAHRIAPRVIATVHGDTSTTMAQPLDDIGAIAREVGALVYVDATATIGGMDIAADRWGADVITGGLQKCLGGPSGSAPITVSDAAAEHIFTRRHDEKGIRAAGAIDGDNARIASNYFDLAMIMDYWGEKRLNHHTEATTMLYGARECARVALGEGLPARYARHRAAGAAMSAGLRAMGLTLFGDDAHRMTNVTGVYIPAGVDGESVRAMMRDAFEIEIGTAFGPLVGKVWRLGAMGYNAMKHKVLLTLAALEACLTAQGCPVPLGQAVPAAIAAWDAAQ